MKDKENKRIKRKENDKAHSIRVRRRIMRLFMLIVVAVIVCSCFALWDISHLGGKALVLGNGLELKTDKVRVYIDQGHNPMPHHNIGAEGNGLYEQDVTFNIGHLLADLLVEDGRFEVCLSRPTADTVLGTDNASSLEARVDGAEKFKADYFISLHINSYSEDTASGIEAFVTGKDSEAHTFGSYLLRGMVASTGLRDRGMKQEEFYVLKNSTMPATLLEMGFISNVRDAKLMSEHPERFAEGIYQGILDYFEAMYAARVNILLWIIGISLAVATVLLIFIIRASIKIRRIKRSEE